MKWLKRKLLSYLTRELLCAVDPESILTEVTTDKGRYYLIGGKQIPSQKLARLKMEANLILETELWKILEHTLRHQAEKVMFTKSTTFEDMITGKSMLHNLDVQDKILNTLVKISLQSK